MEEMLIKKIKGGIMGIMNGTKTPLGSNVPKMLNTLKGINVPMYEDLIEKYKEAKSDYDRREEEKDNN